MFWYLSWLLSLEGATQRVHVHGSEEDASWLEHDLFQRGLPTLSLWKSDKFDRGIVEYYVYCMWMYFDWMNTMVWKLDHLLGWYSSFLAWYTGDLKVWEFVQVHKRNISKWFEHLWGPGNQRIKHAQNSFPTHLPCMLHHVSWFTCHAFRFGAEAYSLLPKDIEEAMGVRRTLGRKWSRINKEFCRSHSSYNIIQLYLIISLYLYETHFTFGPSG